jgi:ribosomal protein L28
MRVRMGRTSAKAMQSVEKTGIDAILAGGESREVLSQE